MYRKKLEISGFPYRDVIPCSYEVAPNGHQPSEEELQDFFKRTFGPKEDKLSREDEPPSNLLTE